MKKCCKCGLEKDVTEFYRATKRKDGFQSMCKKCQSLNDKLPHRKISHNKAAAKYNKSQKGLDYHADYHFKKKYKIGLEQYNHIYQSQKGLCAICGKVESKGVRLSVDHNHTTGLHRELLCHKCNVAIGLVCENIETLEKMIMYLNKWNPKK